MTEERRKGKRIQKHFLLSYYEKDNSEQRYELTQLKNISSGGMCFVTSKQFATDTKICIELKTPYIAETTYLEGKVLGSNEKVRNLIYETRLEFESLDVEGKFLLQKLVEFFEKSSGEGRNYA